MTKLIETNEFTPEIYQIETTDPVLGGPPHLGNKEGIANIQSQQLANRTKWLRAQIEAIQNGYVTDAELGTALANLVDAAPAHLNTLKELSDAITDNVDLIAALARIIHWMFLSEVFVRGNGFTFAKASGFVARAFRRLRLSLQVSVSG